MDTKQDDQDNQGKLKINKRPKDDTSDDEKDTKINQNTPLPAPLPTIPGI